MTPQLVSGPTPAGPSPGQNAPQRFTYTYKIVFTSDTGFPTNPPSESKQVVISAKITGAVSGETVTGSAVVQLTDQSAPFMTPGPVSWLSNDIRVFQVETGQAPYAGVLMGNTGNPATDATTYIQSLIQAFNAVAQTSPPGNHPFDSIPAGEAASELDTLPTDPRNNNAVYNFAAARVRYQDTGIDAESVRVFFRTFPVAAVSTAYNRATGYRRYSDGVEFGHTIPLLGMQYDATLGQQFETIPFFAEPRIETTALSMDTQTDPVNVQTIAHNAGGSTEYAYYGCWLDLNQPSQTPFPQTPSGDGPYSGTPSNPLVSIVNMMASQHQCLIVEIAYDPIPIPSGATPGSSSMLGQRNLSLGTVANPGDSASRLVPSPFEMQPTASANQASGTPPDELMIDWGDAPTGSFGTLYLPSIEASEILLEATSTSYPDRNLILVDAHTLKFPAGGISYIPVPSGGANIAGLFSVEVPAGVRKGQQFDILVRQLASVSGRFPNEASVADAIEGGKDVWQRVLGTFQVKVLVQTKAEMLAPEERILSVFKWILQGSSSNSRWHPVLSRYVQQIEARVKALGGNSSSVLPSPTGNWQWPQEPGGKPSGFGQGWQVEFTGKVVGLVYDRFGDFDGFILDTLRGERTFYSRERDVEALVRYGMSERTTISVVVDRNNLHRPESIILRGGHRGP